VRPCVLLSLGFGKRKDGIGNILSSPAVGFVTLKKYQSTIQYSVNLKDLKPFTIGTVKSYSYEYAFDHATWLKTDDGAINAARLLQNLKAGRFKIAATYIPDLKYQAKIVGIADDIVFLKPYLTKGRTNYLVFTKAKPHAALAKRFADAIAAFRSTPGYGVLLKKFGGPRADHYPLIRAEGRTQRLRLFAAPSPALAGSFNLPMDGGSWKMNDASIR